MFPAGKLPAKFSRTVSDDPSTCPLCSGPLHLGEADRVVLDRYDREVSRQSMSVMLCSTCEYVKEVQWLRA